MKKNYILLLLSILFVYTTNAQITLSNNVGNTIAAGASVSCPGGENSFARQFALTDFGITGDFQLTSGEFGIETISGIARNITMNVYSSDGNFPASYPGTLLGTQLVNVPATTTDLSIISYSFSTPITLDGTLTHIVVELVQDAADATSLFIGATAEQTAIGYLRSAACGITTYEDPATINFPSAKFYITVSGDLLGIEENSLKNVSVSPNPSKDFININMTNPESIEKVELFDITGKRILNLSNISKINIANLNNGVYMLRIQTSKGSVTKKIVKN